MTDYFSYLLLEKIDLKKKNELRGTVFLPSYEQGVLLSVQDVTDSH